MPPSWVMLATALSRKSLPPILPLDTQSMECYLCAYRTQLCLHLHFKRTQWQSFAVSLAEGFSLSFGVDACVEGRARCCIAASDYADVADDKDLLTQQMGMLSSETIFVSLTSEAASVLKNIQGSSKKNEGPPYGTQPIPKKPEKEKCVLSPKLSTESQGLLLQCGPGRRNCLRIYLNAGSQQFRKVRECRRNRLWNCLTLKITNSGILGSGSKSTSMWS